MISCPLFIEEEQLQPIQTSTFEIKHTIDLDDNNQQENQIILEQKHIILYSSSSELLSIPRINNNSEDYIIGSHVIVNIDHSIYNKSGTIRFIKEISIKTGIWYDIELDESINMLNI